MTSTTTHRVIEGKLSVGVTAGSSTVKGFFFNDTATTEIYTLSLHDALPISDANGHPSRSSSARAFPMRRPSTPERSEEHTSELQSLRHLVCRLLLEKKK